MQGLGGHSAIHSGTNGKVSLQISLDHVHRIKRPQRHQRSYHARQSIGKGLALPTGPSTRAHGASDYKAEEKGRATRTPTSSTRKVVAFRCVALWRVEASQFVRVRACLLF
jgi:hypothetical protein